MSVILSFSSYDSFSSAGILILVTWGSMKVLFYTNELREEWDNFIENSKNGTFMLKRAYMEYHSDRFTDFSLMFYKERKLVAVMPASLHEQQVRSHGGLTYGGIISDTSMKTKLMLEVFEALIGFLKEHDITSLLYKRVPAIYHLYPADEDLYALFRNNAVLVRRDIATAVDFLAEQIRLPKGRRAQISRSKREGVIVQKSEEFEDFINLENEILSLYHNAKAVHSAKELRNLYADFPEEIQLFVANLKNKMIAGVLVFVTKNTVHTQYMAADEIARYTGGLDLLVAHLLEKYSKTKRYFDFGISTEKDGTYLNEGLIAQKEGFGGRGIVYDTYEISL